MFRWLAEEDTGVDRDEEDRDKAGTHDVRVDAGGTEVPGEDWLCLELGEAREGAVLTWW